MDNILKFNKVSMGFRALVLIAAMNVDCSEASKEGQLVPCLFIFGDSLVDNGNNNRIFSIAKANYWPHGIDYPTGPTGRFSNGKTITDVIAEHLGFKSEIPPYSKARGKETLRGVNYASAAAGIRDETGYHLDLVNMEGARSSFRMQVENYKSTVQEMVELLGSENGTAEFVSKCIFSIGIGSNDYLNNYFLPLLYSSTIFFTAQQYATLLIQQYSKLLTTLYNFGARKFALHGLGQVGCVPSILIQYSRDYRTCVLQFNKAIEVFNLKLKSLVDDSNSRHQKHAKYIYIDTYGIFRDIMTNLSTLGFKVANVACCGVGKNNAVIPCLPLQNPCPNRKEFVFWDAFHPTEAVNVIVGSRAFRAKKVSDTHPIDILALVQVETGPKTSL